MKQQHGDILSQTGGVIVQQVNAQGVMGSGLAAAIREKYPQVFSVYSAAVTGMPIKGALLGEVIRVDITDELTILNIIGQLDYGQNPDIRYTSYDALDIAFKKIAKMYRNGQLRGDIHVPRIGAGLGNGNWDIIEQIILTHLNKEFLSGIGSEVVFWTN